MHYQSCLVLCSVEDQTQGSVCSQQAVCHLNCILFPLSLEGIFHLGVLLPVCVHPCLTDDSKLNFEILRTNKSCDRGALDVEFGNVRRWNGLWSLLVILLFESSLEVLFGFFEIGFVCSFGNCPGTSSCRPG